MEKFRGVKKGDFPRFMGNEDIVEKCSYSGAFALNNLLSTISLGLCGNKNAYYSAYVRSNIINTCQ